METKSTYKPEEKADQKADKKADEKAVKKHRKFWRVLDKLRPRYKFLKESGYAFIARPIPPTGKRASSNNPFDAVAFFAYK